MADKNFRVRHGLTVSGNAKASGNLSVQGGTLLSGDVQAKTNVSVGQALSVSGMTSLQGGVVVDTSMNVQTKINANDISSSGDLTVQGGVYLSGAINAKTTLSVGGSTILSGDVQAKGNLSVGSQVTASGSVYAGQQLRAGGSVSVAGQVIAKQGLQVSGNAVVGSLNIQGTGYLSGDVQAKSDISVGGKVKVGGSTICTSAILASNVSTQFLQVSGNASIGGTLVVATADATNVQASGVLSGAQIRGTSLAVTTVDAAGTLQVSGNASIGGTLNVNSTLAVSTGTLLPNIQVKGVGPNLIRFHDSGTTSVTNALDLVYRATPNTLGFEKASDGTKIWETDFDTLTTTFHEPLTVSGIITAATVDATNVQASGVLSGAQIRGTSLAVTTVDAAGTLQVSGTASVGALKVNGLTCLQAGAVVTQGLQLKNELNFDGASEKYMDFALVSSDATQFAANFRSFNTQDQFHTHIKFTRGGGVELYNNGNKKMETNGSGIYVSGTVSANNNVYAAQQLRAGGALSVAGDVRGKGLLQISGTASIGGQIQGGANVYAAQQLRAGGSVSVAGGLIAKGGLQLSGTASVGAIKVTGTTQAKGGISVTQTTTIGGQTFGNGWVRIGTDNAGVALDPNEIYFSGAGIIGTLSGSLTLSPTGNIVTSKAFDSTGNIVTEGVISGSTIRGISLAVTTVDAAGTLQVSGTASVGALKVAGALCAQGQLLVNQNFRVTGTADVNSSMGVSGAISCGSLHSAGGGQFNGTVSVTSLYSSGQVRAAGALSCAGTGHFAQGVQICGGVSCTSIHIGGGVLQTTGNVSGGNLLTGGIVRAGGQICNALQIFSQQTVVARKNLHVSGTCCIGLTTKMVGAVAVCSKLTGTQISCHKLVAQSGRVGGLCSGGGADYAEYFEWMDSNPNVSDRVGRSVVITGPSGKIGIATAGQTPFGVITGRAMVAGNNALQRWDKKYLKDEYLRVRRDENGQKIINPDWNSACTYINRKNRPEWDAVGILGRVTVRVGEPINPNWTKLRVVTATIEEYLVR